MPIRFKCPNCTKTLSVKEHLAGRKANCPACKKPIVIPAPVSAPADVDDLAHSLFSDAPPKKEARAAESVKKGPIKFDCEFCVEPIEIAFEEAGKKVPCPHCRRIVRVPVPEDNKPKNWAEVKKGLAGAQALPDQPKDVANLNTKKNVSQKALEQAGALDDDDDDDDEPIGVLGWLKRIVVLGSVAAALTFAVMVTRDNMSTELQKTTIETLRHLVEPKGKEPPKIALNPIWSAAVHRAIGEHYCNQKMAQPARDQFRTAFNKVPQTSKDKDITPVDRDLFLIDLALAQVELGGTEEEARDKERLAWPDVATEVLSSLDAVAAPEARVMGMRLVGARLSEKKQSVLAISLAGQLRRQSPELIVQQTAFLLARKDAKQAETLLKPPEKDKILDLWTRLAYVEGHTRQGNFKEALDLALAKGPATHRLDACLTGAIVILADRTLPAAEAGPFVNNALDLAASKEVNFNLTPWMLFQLVQTARRTDAASKVQDKKVAAPFQPYLQLAALRQQLATTSGTVSFEAITGFENPNHLTRALAHKDFARHIAKVGHGDDVQRQVESAAEEQLKPFLYAGLALGEQDKQMGPVDQSPKRPMP